MSYCQTVHIGAEISFVLPHGVSLTHAQIRALQSCVEDYILWEMNEVVRHLTKTPCYYGPSIQEMINAEKKETYY